jgi:hypothetical protein
MLSIGEYPGSISFTTPSHCLPISILNLNTIAQVNQAPTLVDYNVVRVNKSGSECLHVLQLTCHSQVATPHTKACTLWQPLLNLLPVDERTVSWLQERLCKSVPSMATDWNQHAKQPCGLAMHTPSHKHPAPKTHTL